MQAALGCGALALGVCVRHSTSLPLSGAANVDGDSLLAEPSAPPSSCQPHALTCLRSLALVSGDLHRDRGDSQKKRRDHFWLAKKVLEKKDALNVGRVAQCHHVPSL